MKNLGEAFRFIIVGIAATIVHYTIYLLLNPHINTSIAYLVGYLISFVLNYLLSNYFTFKTNPTIKKGLGFIFCHAVNCSLHFILFNIFLVLGVPKAFAPIPVYLIVVPVNFFLVRMVIKSSYSKKPWGGCHQNI